MKKSILLIAFSLLVLAFTSCQKYKYCQCYAVVDGEDLGMGEDLEVSAMTEEQLAALNTNNDNVASTELVFGSEGEARTALYGIYAQIASDNLFGGSNHNSTNSGNNGKP